MPSAKRQRKRENSQRRAAALAAQRRRRDLRNRVVVAVVIGAFVVGLVYLLAGSGSKKHPKSAAAASSTTVTTTIPGAVPPGAKITGVTPCPKADGTSPRTMSFAQAPPMCIDASKTYTALMHTDAGDITIALDPTKAPLTVNNFVVLARYHFYDGIIFHRVIPGFVDQGGDPTGTGTGGPGYQFGDELPKPGDYKGGSLAMANSGANTNGSQFFIVVSDSAASQLVAAVGGKANYSLFGQVTSGMDVVQKINADGTSGGTPKVTHKILSVTITES